jgi:anti-sigma B factor antagonist
VQLRTAVRRIGARVLLIEPAGEIDLATAPTLERALVKAGAAGTPVVVVDLHGVTFIDASGIRALLHGQRRLRALGGDLIVTSADGVVRRVFELLGLVGTLNLVPSRGEAIERAKARAVTLHASVGTGGEANTT